MFLTIRESALHVGVSEKTIMRWVRRHRLRLSLGRRDGKRWIDIHALAHWCERNQGLVNAARGKKCAY